MEIQPAPTAALTIREFAREFKISKTAAYLEISAGRLRARKFGRSTLIPRADAEAWFAALPEMRARDAA